MALSLGIRGGGNVAGPIHGCWRCAPEFSLLQGNKIFFLNSMTPNNVIDMIKEGVMIGTASQETAETGRNNEAANAY